MSLHLTRLLSKANALWNLFCSTDKFNAQSSLQPLFKSNQNGCAAEFCAKSLKVVINARGSLVFNLFILLWSMKAAHPPFLQQFCEQPEYPLIMISNVRKLHWTISLMRHFYRHRNGCQICLMFWMCQSITLASPQETYKDPCQLCIQGCPDRHFMALSLSGVSVTGSWASITLTPRRYTPETPDCHVTGRHFITPSSNWP